MDKISNNFNFYPTKFHSKDGIESECKSMPANISELMAKFQKASSRDEVIGILNEAVKNNEMEKIDDITFRCGNYIFQDLLKISGEPQSKILNELNKNNISIAPKLVGSFTFGNYTTLVTEIDGLEGEDLIPLNEGYNKLDDLSKKEAFNDVKKLLSAGVINQGMFTRGNANWFITPNSKKIIITDWKGLRPVDNKERQNLLSACYHTIFNK